MPHDGPVSADATFLFADIAGFTALTEAHGDEQAADLVADFADAVRGELPPGGRHVKTIGDALMPVVPDPAGAVALALRITRELMRAHGSPSVRVGLHHGPAVERGGDYYGAAVNVAARVSDHAVGGEVLLSARTAGLAAEIPGVIYEPRGRHRLRNVGEPVELFAALPVGECTDTHLAVDPVCRMAVDEQQAPGGLVCDGEVHFFCSLECAGRFAREPERYVRSAR